MASVTFNVTLEEVGLGASTEIVLALDAVTFADGADSLTFVDKPGDELTFADENAAVVFADTPETVTFTDQNEDIP